MSLIPLLGRGQQKQGKVAPHFCANYCSAPCLAPQAWFTALDPWSLNRAVLDHAVDQLPEVMAYLAPYSPQGPCFPAVYSLRCCEPLEAFLGPWAGAQAPMTTALGLTGYGWFTACIVGE